MKKTLLISFVFVFLFALTINAKPRPGVSFSFFYSSLQPYGEWIQLHDDVVGWRPYHINSGWRPYTVGRWSWTEDGWYWDSDEPYGWATYHYGRWYLDDNYGWMWIPDYEWGPSWVEWRYNDDYIGWAPLPPYASFDMHLGIHFSIGWHAGYNWWNFVGYNRFCDSRLHHYLLDFGRSRRIFGATKYRNNFYYDHNRIINGGIDREFVERRGGYRISEREIRTMDNRNEFERSRGRDGNRVYAYRPSEGEINRSSKNDRFEIRQGERSSSIDRDKLSTPRFTERANANINEGVRERRNDNPNYTSPRENIRSREEVQPRENVRPEFARPNGRTFERPQIENRPQQERRAEPQRSAQPERRVERRQEQSYDRPSSRMQSSNERQSDSRSESRGNRESRDSRESDRRR